LNNEIHLDFTSPLDALSTKVAHVNINRVLLIIIAKRQYRILSVCSVEDKQEFGRAGCAAERKQCAVARRSLVNASLVVTRHDQFAQLRVKLQRSVSSIVFIKLPRPWKICAKPLRPCVSQRVPPPRRNPSADMNRVFFAAGCQIVYHLMMSIH
jgi:hypothetical protein